MPDGPQHTNCHTVLKLYTTEGDDVSVVLNVTQFATDIIWQWLVNTGSIRFLLAKEHAPFLVHLILCSKALQSATMHRVDSVTQNSLQEIVGSKITHSIIWLCKSDNEWIMNFQVILKIWSLSVSLDLD